MLNTEVAQCNQPVIIMVDLSVTDSHLPCNIYLLPGLASGNSFNYFLKSYVDMDRFHRISLKVTFVQAFLSARSLTLAINCKCIFVEEDLANNEVFKLH